MRTDDELAAAYEKAVGHPPRNVHADDPDWNYRGSKTEREALKERVQGSDQGATVIEGQEVLFDA